MPPMVPDGGQLGGKLHSAYDVFGGVNEIVCFLLNFSKEEFVSRSKRRYLGPIA